MLLHFYIGDTNKDAMSSRVIKRYSIIICDEFRFTEELKYIIVHLWIC